MSEEATGLATFCRFLRSGMTISSAEADELLVDWEVGDDKVDMMGSRRLSYDLAVFPFFGIVRVDTRADTGRPIHVF